jgi:hypothetical protein
MFHILAIALCFPFLVSCIAAHTLPYALHCCMHAALRIHAALLHVRCLTRCIAAHTLPYALHFIYTQPQQVLYKPSTNTLVP